MKRVDKLLTEYFDKINKPDTDRIRGNIRVRGRVAFVKKNSFFSFKARSSFVISMITVMIIGILAIISPDGAAMSWQEISGADNTGIVGGQLIEVAYAAYDGEQQVGWRGSYSYDNEGERIRIVQYIFEDGKFDEESGYDGSLAIKKANADGIEISYYTKAVSTVWVHYYRYEEDGRTYLLRASCLTNSEEFLLQVLIDTITA